MKVKVEMIVEVSKEVDGYDVESHIQDALSEYTGNDIEFYDCNVEKCEPALKKFNIEHEGITLECIETFEATHTNVVGNKPVTYKQTFIAGSTYYANSWRPEGMHIDNFWVFNKDANKFIA